MQYFGSRIHERFERIQAMFSDISARAQENFSGARVVRAFAQEEAEIAAFETANREYISRSLKLVRLMGMLWPTLETLLGLAVVLVLWLGGREVLSGQIAYRSEFVAFNTYMVQLTWPMIALGWVHQHVPARHRLHGYGSTRSLRSGRRSPIASRRIVPPRRFAARSSSVISASPTTVCRCSTTLA